MNKLKTVILLIAISSAINQGIGSDMLTFANYFIQGLTSVNLGQCFPSSWQTEIGGNQSTEAITSSPFDSSSGDISTMLGYLGEGVNFICKISPYIIKVQNGVSSVSVVLDLVWKSIEEGAEKDLWRRSLSSKRNLWSIDGALDDIENGIKDVGDGIKNVSSDLTGEYYKLKNWFEGGLYSEFQYYFPTFTNFLNNIYNFYYSQGIQSIISDIKTANTCLHDFETTFRKLISTIEKFESAMQDMFSEAFVGIAAYVFELICSYQTLIDAGNAIINAIHSSGQTRFQGFGYGIGLLIRVLGNS